VGLDLTGGQREESNELEERDPDPNTNNEAENKDKVRLCCKSRLRC